MTKDEEDLIIAEQNKSTEEILKAIKKVKLDCQELCNLKNIRIEELEKENRLLKNKENLTDKIADIKANCDFALEGKDVEIMELKKENAELKEDYGELHNLKIKDCCELLTENAELKTENNKLLDVINNQDVKIADLEKMLAEQYPDLKQSLD